MSGNIVPMFSLSVLVLIYTISDNVVSELCDCYNLPELSRCCVLIFCVIVPEIYGMEHDFGGFSPKDDSHGVMAGNLVM